MPSPKLLMACTNYWTSPFQVGSHHLARGFVKAGWMVGFVSEPISPWHLFGQAKVDLVRRFALYRRGGSRDLDGRLWAYVPGALLAPQNQPLLRSEAVQRGWSRLTWPLLVSHIRKQGFGDVNLLYCDSPKHISWLQHVRRGRTVYRIADNTSGFGRTTKAAERAEHSLAGSADLVIYSAQNLKSYIKSFNPRRMEYLPNGVDYAHFAVPSPAVPVEYEHIRRPIAVYAGAMEAWFDYTLMNDLVAVLPGVSFVLIGGNPAAHARLIPMPNLHLLGTRPFARLPEYLQAARVGIIPFDVQGHPALVNSIHPLKLYEYLASGLPVVATRWREMESLQSPAVLCDSAKEFATALETCIAQPPQKAVCQAYAAQHDWSRRVMRLLDLVCRDRAP